MLHWKKKLGSRIGVLLLAFAAMFGIGVFNAGSASATQVSFHIQHIQAGYCLDSNSAGSVYMNPCQADNQYQQWRYIWYSNVGAYAIQDVMTGRCLNSSSSGLGTIPTCGGLVSYGQWWNVWSGNWGSQFENWDNDYCLDGANQSVYPTRGTCVASNLYQNWYAHYL